MKHDPIALGAGAALREIFEQKWSNLELDRLAGLADEAMEALFPRQPDYSADMPIDQWSIPATIANGWAGADQDDRDDVDRLIATLKRNVERAEMEQEARR
jgi:hypothetical protein